MRDLFVLGILIVCIGATFYRPWFGVLGLALFSYMNPHAFAWGFMRSFPVYLTLFVTVSIAFLTAKDKQPIPKDWRIGVFYCLWAYFVMTTFFAKVPIAAETKLIAVSKIYLPLFFTLILINTRQKLYYLLVTIGGSIAFISAKGGAWAIATGFANRVYGPTGTQYGGNNEFAVASLVAIPLLILWYREEPRKWIRLGIIGAIPLCLAAVVSSWSRGAFLTLGVLTVVLLWHSKRKVLIVPVVAIGVAVLISQLPEEWFGRMETIETYKEDASAMSRITAWKEGASWALGHPFIGSGFEGWKYVTISDWHSAYVEIMAEHGLIAFFMWFLLLYGTMLSLTRLGFLGASHPELAWVKNYAHMLRASLIAYAVGSLFLGISYWDLLYHLIFASVLLKQFALQQVASMQSVPAPAQRLPSVAPVPFPTPSPPALAPPRFSRPAA